MNVCLGVGVGVSVGVGVCVGVGVGVGLGLDVGVGVSVVVGVSVGRETCEKTLFTLSSPLKATKLYRFCLSDKRSPKSPISV